MSERSFPVHAKARLLAALAAAALPLVGETLPKESPFLPPPGEAAATAPAASSGYQLSGMTEVGRDVLLSITRDEDKRSLWIPVGKTVAEITAVNYDAAREQAVIRVAGKEHTLAMRKAAVVSAAVTPLISGSPNAIAASPQIAPAQAPAVDPPVVIGPLSLQEEKEMEARMLVTDLLEIGQRQRKAYAEAQRQAALKAGETQSQPTPPAPAEKK